MKKGEPIEIKEIHNGVLISPVRSSTPLGERTNEKEFIAFQSAEEFTKWISIHFCVYKQSTWDDSLS